MLAVELVDHAARQHRLGKKKTNLLTYKSILDHMDYQPMIECFKNSKVCLRNEAYAEELANIKEALVQSAHSNPSAEEMQVRSGDAAVCDAWLSGTVRELCMPHIEAAPAWCASSSYTMSRGTPTSST